jgi:hypothetical protein
VELALLIDDGGMVAGNEGVRQDQVPILQTPDGEWRVRNVDLFLTGFIDQQQSSSRNWLGHKAIAPEIGGKLAGITGLMLRKLPHAWCGKASSAGTHGGRNSRTLTATIVSLEHPSVEKLGR